VGLSEDIQAAKAFEERKAHVWERTEDGCLRCPGCDITAARSIDLAGCPSAPQAVDVPRPSVGRIVHYYGKLMVSQHVRSEPTCDMYIPPIEESGPFAALVVDVGPEPTTVTLKITDRTGGDHVRANVKYGDPGWMWPPRVG
jgi:hypothetical protein